MSQKQPPLFQVVLKSIGKFYLALGVVFLLPLLLLTILATYLLTGSAGDFGVNLVALGSYVLILIVLSPISFGLQIATVGGIMISKFAQHKKLGTLALYGPPTFFIVVLLFFTYQAIQPLFIGQSSSYPALYFKKCSWLDKTPRDWKCEDNWSSEHRIITATAVGFPPPAPQLRLDITNTKLAATQYQCQVFWPSLTYYFPSASGITLPRSCYQNGNLVHEATWNQDGYFFRLSGENVQADLFLTNLQSAGK